MEITFHTLKSGDLKVRREEGLNEISFIQLSMDFPALVPRAIPNIKIRYDLRDTVAFY